MADSDDRDDSLPPQWYVHERGNRSLDGILRLIELASSTRPIDEILAAMCAHVAEISGADVVSVYVRESELDEDGQGPQDNGDNGDSGDSDAGGDWLVMRGNVGFPRESIGQVALRVGEGLTGFVAERMRPVSVRAAQQDAHFKAFPGLDEDNVPVFVGVPIMHGGQAGGVLVLQRRASNDFELDEVPLLAALAAPFSFALDAATRRAREQSSAPRFARLSGRAIAPGVVMGKAAFVPTLASLVQEFRGDEVAYDASVMAAAWNRLDRAWRRSQERLSNAAGKDRDRAVLDRALADIALVADDRRFRDCIIEEWQQSGLGAGLRTVAQRYAKVAHRGDRDSDTLARRARNIEDICVFFHAAVTGQRLMPASRVWLADHLGGPVALAAVVNRALALVVASDVSADEPGAIVARSAGLPVVSAVDGLFACARSGDLVVVDGDDGAVLINPSASAVAQVRNQRRS